VGIQSLLNYPRNRLAGAVAISGISGTGAIIPKFHGNQIPPIPDKFEIRAPVPEIPWAAEVKSSCLSGKGHCEWYGKRRVKRGGRGPGWIAGAGYGQDS